MQNDNFENNFENNYENQIKLIEDDSINVSEPNVLKELMQIVINILLFILIVYTSVFILSGIVIKSLSVEKQIAVENALSKLINEKDVEKTDNATTEKINNIKKEILKYDKNFPKTSKLNIKIIKNDEPNALCLPNGNIYITSSLFEKIKENDEMLFFVLAHEMAHYKNKDHIMNLRKGLASFTVLMLIYIGEGDNNNLSSIVEKTMDLSDLNYSRATEAKADKYAAHLLIRKYKSINGGVATLELLRDKNYPEIFYIFSDHPSIDKRIEALKQIKK